MNHSKLPVFGLIEYECLFATRFFSYWLLLLINIDNYLQRLKAVLIDSLFFNMIKLIYFKCNKSSQFAIGYNLTFAPENKISLTVVNISYLIA